MITRNTLISTLACAGLLAAGGCVNRATDGMDVMVTDTREAGADAIGLPRERPGAIRVDEGDDTVPTPYGGKGARRTCSTTARDIARLTVVLGPDREAPPSEVEEETDEDDPTLAERSRDLAADAPDLARDQYRSLIVSLNPIRPVVRFVGRASEIESAARTERELALKRRSYLRGLHAGFGCGPRYLERAFEAYGLTQTE
ncbi:hypothetical protein F1654_00690 [Alkalicaulis satelles]|uniref:DUF3035 domain-containing protein n=1 Tax=Alkalicaulis satelles TaxID=2609175 RepID=A0A5M6ZQL8_9PROT|nr:hypothetical protein [Alkalicaulis satelles]KAA5804561.1 hypothetical protein F1654_00690 [Alkalicaulis satelles]